MRLSDTRSGYGWISIAFHWSTAAIIIWLWLIGKSITDPATLDGDRVIRLHTTVALGFYILLWARVIWRFRIGHPGPSGAQKPLFFNIGKLVHMGLLVAISGMLLSGPVLAWSGGIPVRLFDLVIPSPFPQNAHVFQAAWWLHRTLALIIISGVGLHILGVFKHAVFDRDGTFDRMMVPQRDDDDAPPEDGSEPAATRPETAAETR